MFAFLSVFAMVLAHASAPGIDNDAHVRAMAEPYFQALERGQPDGLKSVFHSAANLFWVDDQGRLQSRTQPSWRDLIARQGPQHAQSREVLDVQVDHDVAMVKARSVLADRTYTDYLLLLHAEGRWLIVNKTFSVAKPGDQGLLNQASELADIRVVLQRKIEASAENDGGLLAMTHHPRAVYYTLIDHMMSADSLAEWIGRYDARRASHPAAPQWHIVSVEQTGSAAVAKLDSTLGSTRYVDFISLLKIDGRWQIISAVWAEG
jgi:hypothetical protein